MNQEKRNMTTNHSGPSRYSVASVPLMGDQLSVDVFSINSINDSSYVRGKGKFFEDAHNHIYFEMHAVESGENVYAFGKKSVTVKTDQFLLIRPNTMHYLVSRKEGTEKFGFCFIIQTTGGSCREEHHLVNALLKEEYILGTFSGRMKTLFQFALQESQHSTWGNMLGIRMLAGMLILEIAKSSDVAAPDIMGEMIPKHDMRFSIAKQFIQDNVHIPLSCAKVATISHLSVRQLDRIFLAECSMTVKEYINFCKHTAAKNRLRSTDDAIQNISADLGFANPYVFTRFFKKMEGISPSKYRKKL
ncbi:MAG TPA: AraC family transcriptional regulator [Feifaniaceae bacterium]|nr:AraC family transcriptional regulator [Feifaniaceae bacterium]